MSAKYGEPFQQSLLIHAEKNKFISYYLCRCLAHSQGEHSDIWPDRPPGRRARSCPPRGLCAERAPRPDFHPVASGCECQRQDQPALRCEFCRYPSAASSRTRGREVRRERQDSARHLSVVMGNESSWTMSCRVNFEYSTAVINTRTCLLGDNHRSAEKGNLWELTVLPVKKPLHY